MIKPNYLSPVEYRFTIKRLPNVSFFVQSVSIPGMSSGNNELPTPFKNVPLHGDKLEYEALSLQVAMDENMQSFIEVRNWLIGLTKPYDFEQHANLIEGEGLYSDATLLIMNSSKNPNIEVTFKDIFPTSIGEVAFDTRGTDVDVPTSTMTFLFNDYDIKLSS